MYVQVLFVDHLIFHQLFSQIFYSLLHLHSSLVSLKFAFYHQPVSHHLLRLRYISSFSSFSYLSFNPHFHPHQHQPLKFSSSFYPSSLNLHLYLWKFSWFQIPLQDPLDHSYPSQFYPFYLSSYLYLSSLHLLPPLDIIYPLLLFTLTSLYLLISSSF